MDEVRTIELFRHQVPGLHQIAEDVKKFIADMLAKPVLVHEPWEGLLAPAEYHPDPIAVASTHPNTRFLIKINAVREPGRDFFKKGAANYRTVR